MEKIKRFLLELLWILPTLAVVGGITYVFLPLTTTMSVNGESLYMPYISQEEHIQPNSFWQVFTANNRSLYVLSMFWVLTARYLPRILDIHPQVCINTVTCWFMFSLFLCLLFALANNFFKYLKTRYFYAPVLAFVFVTVVALLQQSQFIWMFRSDWLMYAYVFLPIFGLLLLNYSEYFYITKKPLSVRNKVVLVCLFFVVAISHEMFREIVLLSLPIIFIVEKFILKSPLNIKKSLLAYFGIAICYLITIFTHSYQTWLVQHGNRRAFAEWFVFFKEYSQAFLKYAFVDNAVLLFSLFLTSVLVVIFVKDKEKNIKFLTFTYSVLFSVVFFMFAVIFGKAVSDIDLYVQHNGTAFMYRLVLLSLLISGFGYLIAYGKKLYDVISPNVPVVVLSCLVLFLSVHSWTFNFNHEIEEAREIRQDNYVIEKTFLLNGKENKTYYVFFHNASIIYLTQVYGASRSPYDYEVVNVCGGETLKLCRKLLIEKASEVTGYNFTDEEIQKEDFDSLRYL